MRGSSTIDAKAGDEIRGTQLQLEVTTAPAVSSFVISRSFISNREPLLSLMGAVLGFDVSLCRPH